MRISDKDITRAARELRDEENRQLHVRPWSRQRHFQLPAWLTAIPAAAIIGFLLGFWTNSHTQGEPSVTALVDTVYVTAKESSARLDTLQATDDKVPLPTTKQVRRTKVRRAKVNKQKCDTYMGQPVTSDRIRYDLLVNR